MLDLDIPRLREIAEKATSQASQLGWVTKPMATFHATFNPATVLPCWMRSTSPRS
jgi:hypothetical protein